MTSLPSRVLLWIVTSELATCPPQITNYLLANAMEVNTIMPQFYSLVPCFPFIFNKTKNNQLDADK